MKIIWSYCKRFTIVRPTLPWIHCLYIYTIKYCIRNIRLYKYEFHHTHWIHLPGMLCYICHVSHPGWRGSFLPGATGGIWGPSASSTRHTSGQYNWQMQRIMDDTRVESRSANRWLQDWLEHAGSTICLGTSMSTVPIYCVCIYTTYRHI